MATERCGPALHDRGHDTALRGRKRSTVLLTIGHRQIGGTPRPLPASRRSPALAFTPARGDGFHEARATLCLSAGNPDVVSGDRLVEIPGEEPRLWPHDPPLVT